MSDLPYDMAVIGGGFAGLMTVANVMRKAKKTPRIFWADPEAAMGFGLAYSTMERCHLLNVRADRMGAWADGIDDFWRWLQKNHPGAFQAESFAPRMIYGEYLDSIRENFADVPLEDVAVKSARRQDDLWILNAGKKRIAARTLVLATGNPPIASLSWPDNDIYIANFWRWRLDGESAQRLKDSDTAVIAGAGLTAADACLSLRSDGFRGRIVCVSPHGHLPEVHEATAAYTQGDALCAELKQRAECLHYLKTMRRHCRAAPWRAVIDAVRPQTVALWQALPPQEQARFMRHLWSRWNVHRHRMAPEIRRQLDGDVDVLAGRIIKTEEDGTVHIRLRGSGTVEHLKAAKVLNCTGPSYRRMADENPLLRSLKEEGVLKPGPLGLGIATPEAPGLYVIGTLLLGERFETTAVPELRAQAAELAKRVFKG